MTVTRPAPSRVGRGVLVPALVVLATLLGGWRVAALVAGGQDPMTLKVGDATFRVTHVEQVTGLTDADVGGMSHGVQDLVTNDKALVRVTVTVSSGDSATTYDATRLRAFAAGSSVGTAPVGSSLPKGRLGAHARIEGSLSYVVPRNGAQLVLRADNAPHAVPLLQVDTAVPGAGDHLHAPSGASGNGAPPPSKP